MKATLPRTVRLRGKGSFSVIFESGTSVRRGQIVAKYTVRPSEGHSVHVGFVVRRAAGPAVRRNRLRRMLREAYRLQRLDFEQALPGGIDVRLLLLWVGSTESALRPDFGAIGADLGAALHKVIRRLQTDGTAEHARHE
jgi:ribonuclease P protein component